MITEEKQHIWVVQRQVEIKEGKCIHAVPGELYIYRSKAAAVRRLRLMEKELLKDMPQLKKEVDYSDTLCPCTVYYFYSEGEKYTFTIFLQEEEVR